MRGLSPPDFEVAEKGGDQRPTSVDEEGQTGVDFAKSYEVTISSGAHGVADGRSVSEIPRRDLFP